MDSYEQAIQEAMRLVQTPQGQQLLRKLQEMGGSQLQQAAQYAAAGDLTRAKELLAAFQNQPEAEKLLEQFRR